MNSNEAIINLNYKIINPSIIINSNMKQITTHIWILFNNCKIKCTDRQLKIKGKMRRTNKTNAVHKWTQKFVS